MVQLATHKSKSKIKNKNKRGVKMFESADFMFFFAMLEFVTICFLVLVLFYMCEK